MKRFVLSMVAGLLLSSAAFGAQITYTDSVSLQTTNFNETFSVPLFDSSLGTLTGITWTLSGVVVGDIRFESLDSAPSTVNANLQATITLQRPDLSTLVVVIPVFSVTDNLSAADGTIDFGGTSGRSYIGVTGNDSDSASSSSATDLALFTGVGNITLPVTALGTSFASGAGNLITQFATQASADLSITYTYDTATVPEPASALLIVPAAAALFLARRRRQ